MTPVRDAGAASAAIGAWLSLGSPAVAEVLASCGFSWALIDQQHSAIGPTEMLQLVRTLGPTSAAPIVRIPANSPEYFAYALDAGAHGVMVPMIETREQAEAAVEAFRYPPGGARSIGGYRAHLAFKLDRQEYLRAPPGRLILQIEHRRAVENADEIASVAGVDALFVGPQDLSASYGLEPSVTVTDPVANAALDHLVEITRKAKMDVGILCDNVASAREYVRRGFTMVAVGTDASMLTSAGRAIVNGLRS